MKTSILTSLLVSTALAQDQMPLKDIAAGWFDKAKSYIPSAAPSISDPVAAGATAYSAKNVQKINIRNYKRILQPKVGHEEEWLVYMTGGNKTCFGRCGKTDVSWNEAVPLLTALPHPAGKPSLHLGRIDCEADSVLCTGWSADVPAIWHFQFPQLSVANQSPPPPTPLRIARLNTTTTQPTDIVRLASSAPNSQIEEFTVYEGLLHPVDGLLARFGVQEYLGWFLYGMGTTPSWLIMIVISFVSRQIMSRRTLNRNVPNIYGNAAPAVPGTGAGTGAARPAAPAAAKPATPASGKKGGKRR